MKCPKCNYTSFDYLENCKRCGVDLRDARSLLQIIAVSPEDTAPAAPAMEMMDEEIVEEVALPAEESFDDMQPMGEDEELLDGLDFEGSFDDLMESTSYADAEPAASGDGPVAPDPVVEHTSYADQEAEAAVSRAPASDEEDDELLDLDFGDLFEEKGD